MDCCEFRGAGAGPPYGAAGAWPLGYAPPASPYAPYAHYYPPPHDPYRYYRYDYPHHAPHPEHHIASMDYGVYASREARVRRAIARRDARALTPSHHLPLPHTPSIDCGMNGRGPAYGEPQMWHHYQMGLGGGWNNGTNEMGAAWGGRGACGREQMRYSPDYRALKNSHHHASSPMCVPEGRSTPYPMYDESSYDSNSRNRNTPEFPTAASTPQPVMARARERYTESKPSPTEEKRPPVVPLPAFQQAFGSTEIGKFAEAFSRAEVTHEESSSEFMFESFPDWEATSDQQWPAAPATPAPREIKCEDNF